jgi:hypothetical protein
MWMPIFTEHSSGISTSSAFYAVGYTFYLTGYIIEISRNNKTVQESS